MRFSLGNLDVTDIVGIVYFLGFGDDVLGDKEDGIVPFNKFGGETEFTPTLCQAEKLICSGDLRTCFFGAGSESMEKGFGTCNGVDHHGRGGNDWAWLIVASVSSWVSMWR